MTDEREVDIAAEYATRVGGRLAVNDPDLTSPTAAPNGYSFLFGGYFGNSAGTPSAGSGGSGSFGSTYTIDRPSGQGFLLSNGIERRHFALWADEMIGWGSISGTVSWQQPLPFGVTSAGPFRYTGSFIANSVTMRIGARLPIRNVALAAGTGIGASLIDFNSTTVDASSTEIVGIEVGALKSRLHRARMALRTQLAGVVGASGGEACPELAQELTAYAASEIDQATCEKIEQHLAGCPRCTGACDALKRTVSLCKSIGDAVPAPVRTAVRGAIRDAIGH